MNDPIPALPSDVCNGTNGKTNPRTCPVWWALLLLAVCVVAAVGTQLNYGFFWGEHWVVRGVIAGRRGITPPLLYLLLLPLRVLTIDSELVWRLPSLLAALMALIALPAWAHMTRADRETIVACWLTAVLLACCSPVLVYAAMCKSYALEVLLSVLGIVGLLHSAERTSLRFWVVYSMLAVVAVTTTYTGALTVLGVGSAMLLRTGFSPSPQSGANCALPGRRLFAQCLGVHLVLGALAVVAYVFVLRNRVPAGELGSPGQLDRYWAYAFWDGSATFVVSRTVQYAGQFLNVGRFALHAVLLTTVVWGWRVFRTRSCRDLIVTAPLLACTGSVLIASRFRMLPYGETRIMLFVAPFFFWAVATMLAGHLIRPNRARRVVGVVAGVILIAACAKGLIASPYARGFLNHGDYRQIYALLNAPGAGGQVEVYAGGMDRRRLLDDGVIDHARVFPLDAAGMRGWNSAWVVVDRRTPADMAVCDALAGAVGTEVLADVSLPGTPRIVLLMRMRGVTLGPPS